MPAPQHERSFSPGVSALVAVAAGLLTAAAVAFPAFLVGIGVRIALGNGDPTWNDGEETWAVPGGLLIAVPILLLSLLGLRAWSRRTQQRFRGLTTSLWLTPIVLVLGYALLIFSIAP